MIKKSFQKYIFFKYERLKLLYFLFIGSFFSGYSQPINFNFNNIIDFTVEQNLLIKTDNFHFSVKPYKINEINSLINLDTLNTNINEFSNSGLLRKIGAIKPLILRKNKLGFNLYPLFDIGYGRDFDNSKDENYSGIGFRSVFNFSDKVAIGFSFVNSKNRYTASTDSLIDVSQVIPYESSARKVNSTYAYDNFAFYLSYNPSRYFNLELGKGKNFWGEGYRSLLLSDNSNSYPYFKITSTFWKIKYVNLYTKFQNIGNINWGIESSKSRYSSMHYLSWNILKHLNLSFFEAVMWRGNSDNNTRGFEINYLNPVIFYRPVEYSLGSPDNVIMGGNFSLKLFKTYILYTQVMIDEFVLTHIRQRDGWWANKYGYQLGFKAYNLLNVENLSFLTEFNLVRPYTYSHFNSEQNYSHYNQSLAHPLGANFKETVSLVNYQINKFILQFKYNHIIYGADKEGKNYGQNIFIPYKSYINEFNNYVGQGLENKLDIIDANCSYIINPWYNLIFEAGIYMRLQRNELYKKNNAILYFGIKTNLQKRNIDW